MENSSNQGGKMNQRSCVQRNNIIDTALENAKDNMSNIFE